MQGNETIEMLGLFEKLYKELCSKISTEDNTPIDDKIENKTVTCEDFDRLIIETFKNSITDRVQRRLRKPPEESHIDNETGHQSLTLPNMADRVVPKHQTGGQNQMRHRGKSAHDKSTRTQIRKAANGQ